MPPVLKTRKAQYHSNSPLILLVLLGLLVVATLVVISNYFLRPAMESSLKQEIKASLKQQGLIKTKLSISGRDVIISGKDQFSVKKAQKVVKGIKGIRQIESVLVIKNQTID